MIVATKGQLAIALSKLKGFIEPKISMEQYETDSETAAALLWNMHMLGDIEGKAIADLGAGTGRLGTGCILLGAKRVLFVESEGKALDLAKENLRTLGLLDYAELIAQDVRVFNQKADVVIQNPPFGTKQEHADRVFLETAVRVAPVIYTLHKTTTVGFVRAFAKDNGYLVTHEWQCTPLLWQTAGFHRRQTHRIEATWFRLEAYG